MLAQKRSSIEGMPLLQLLRKVEPCKLQIETR